MIKNKKIYTWRTLRQYSDSARIHMWWKGFVKVGLLFDHGGQHVVSVSLRRRVTVRGHHLDADRLFDSGSQIYTYDTYAMQKTQPQR